MCRAVRLLAEEEQAAAGKETEAAHMAARELVKREDELSAREREVEEKAKRLAAQEADLKVKIIEHVLQYLVLFLPRLQLLTEQEKQRHGYGCLLQIREVYVGEQQIALERREETASGKEKQLADREEELAKREVAVAKLEQGAAGTLATLASAEHEQQIGFEALEAAKAENDERMEQLREKEASLRRRESALEEKEAAMEAKRALQEEERSAMLRAFTAAAGDAVQSEIPVGDQEFEELLLARARMISEREAAIRSREQALEQRIAAAKEEQIVGGHACGANDAPETSSQSHGNRGGRLSSGVQCSLGESSVSLSILVRDPEAFPVDVSRVSMLDASQAVSTHGG